MDADYARERLERERRWLEARGGQSWTAAYIQPFYMTMQGHGRYTAEAETLIPLLRSRASELTLDEISEMVTMQWRLQAAGAWFAVARTDASLSGAVHDGFESCYGTLTAPSLTVAALTYPNDATSEVLRRYHDRDIANRYGSAGIVAAALRRLDSSAPQQDPTPDDDYLDELMARAARAQSG